MITAGIDVGFGFTKAVGNGRQRIFRSAIGAFSPIAFQPEGAGSGTSTAIEFGGRRLFVGDAALRQATPEATITANRTVTFEGMALLMAAIHLLVPDQLNVQLRLVVGLPIQQYSKLKESYIAAAMGDHNFKIVSLDGASEYDKKVEIVSVKVLPQPFGCVFDRLLDGQGRIVNKAMATGQIGIIDGGYNTLDLLRVENLEYINRRSTSYSEMGVFEVSKLFSNRIYDRLGVEIPPEKAEQYIKSGSIKISGKMYSLAGILDECYEIEVTNVISRVKSIWPDYALLDAIIPTGGGIIPIQNRLKDTFGEIVQTGANLIWDNANGFEKYGKLAWPS